ncbi:hypothetical protein [Vreelandella aquamarina]|uniref:hypothetical protein n=1 Tax=Vreelandella aquamarina TaxID=77097 RepID=UPI001D174E1D|nr:hypothetical protein [Halomonas axialensis]
MKSAAPKAAFQPRPTRSPKSAKKPDVEPAIADYLAQHYMMGYDERDQTLYAVLATGHAYAITDSDLHESIACELDDQGIDATPKAVRAYLAQKAFKLKRSAEAIKVTQRVKGSPYQGEVIIDLGDNKGTFIRLTPEKGVEILDERPSPDTVMLRPAKQVALPYPTHTSSEEGVNKLLALLKQLEEKEALIFIGWLTNALTHEVNPDIPRVFLVLLGPQSSGKTAFCQQIIQRFLDPNRIGVQRMPEKFEDIAIGTQQCYVPIFDNVATVSGRLSDSFCQMATGGSTVTRQLFTDNNAVITQMQTNMVFNGIEQPFTKPDLISRSLFLHFQPLSLEQRQSKVEIEAYLDQHEGEIMGGLLHLCVMIMREWPHATPQTNGRAVDFCRWLAAFDRVLDQSNSDSGEEDTPFSLEAAYASNLSHAYTTTLIQQPVAYLVYHIVLQHQGVWEGTMTELFNLLQPATETGVLRIHPAQLPHNVESLGIQMKQGGKAEAYLNRVGITVTHKRQRQRKIVLTCDEHCSGLDRLPVSPDRE